MAVITAPPRTSPPAPTQAPPMYETLDLPLDARGPSGPIAERWEKQRFENLNQLANTSIDRDASELAPFPASGFRLLTSDFRLLPSDF